MPTNQKTKNFPFGQIDISTGERVSTLILCLNEHHMVKIIDAFKIAAEYHFGLPALAGRRYQKIIAFIPYTPSHTEAERWRRYVHERLATMLSPNGELHTI